MDLSTAARLLHEAITSYPHTPIVDDTNQCDGVRVVSNFLICTVLRPSERFTLSAAETCFLLRVVHGKVVAWPTTLEAARVFLERLWVYIATMKTAAVIDRLWAAGFIFFGTSSTIALTMRQLGLQNRVAQCDMVLSAGYHYFSGSKATRTITSLSYNIIDNDGWFPIAPTSIPHYLTAVVFCPDLDCTMSLAMLRRAYVQIR